MKAFRSEMKKFLSVCLMLMMVMVVMLTPALANEVGSGVASDGSGKVTATTGSETETDGQTGGYMEGVMDPQDAAGIPDVSTDDLIDRIDEKGNDVVNVLQAVGKWACIVVFIVCIILFIVGLIGNKRLAVAAFVGMLFAGIGYAGILCGREIVSFIASWAAS